MPRAGAAVVDVTPAPGTAMSGFVARTAPATGAHDPLTVRALVVGASAVVTLDVVGLHESDCAAVRSGCTTSCRTSSCTPPTRTAGR